MEHGAGTPDAGGDPDAAGDPARLHTLLGAGLDLVPHPVVILRAIRSGGVAVDFAYEYVNGAACEISRRSHEEHLAGTVLGLFPEQAANGLLDCYRSVLAAGEPVHWTSFRYVAERGDEPVVHVLDLRVARAAADVVVCTWADVTEDHDLRRRVRTTERELRAALDNFLEAVVIASADRQDGRIVDFVVSFANRASVDAAGRGPADFRGARLSSLYPELVSAFVPAYCAVVETGVPLVLDGLVRDVDTPAGRVRRRFDLRVIRHGDGVIVVWRDVTERHEAEERLAEVHAALERHATELERSNAELAEFAYVASHDLAAPLRSIEAFTNLLAERYAGSLGPDADEFIRYIREGVTRMQAMVGDLLAYARVDTSSRPEDVDTAALVAEVLAGLAAEIEAGNAQVTVGELPVVRAVRTQLARVFQNLVVNALMFVEKGASPRVDIAARRDGAAWRFEVADRGIGIDAAKRARIFRMFQRLHGHDEYAGSGMGLAISKKIVERHGGRIWVEAGDGAGSRFCFTIPD